MNIVYWDFETFYGREYTLSKMTTQSYVLDERFRAHGGSIAVNDGPIKWIPRQHIPAVMQRIDWSRTALCGHNLMFDGSILAWHYGVRPALYLDTLGMARALVGAHSARHGLTYVAQLLLGEGKLDDGTALANTLDIYEPEGDLLRRLARYCDHDVYLTRGILKKMLPHFPKNELKVLDRTVRRFCEPRVYLDGDMLNEYLEMLGQRKEQVLINAGLENRDVLMSNDKFAAALENLGVMPPTKINAKGKVTFAFAKTDEGLKALLEHDNPDVQALVAARLEVKSTIEQTRAQRFLEASELGAFPIPVNYAGANVTQRDSGADKLNMKNLTRGGTLRMSIYAPAGYIFVVSDLSQIECRITLWLGSQMPRSKGMEAESLELMRNGGDLYSWFGSLIYGYEINKKDHPLERQIAKSAVLGLGFGMGKDKFIIYCKSQGINMTEELAERVVKLYRQTYTGVVQYWYSCGNMLSAIANDQDYALPSPELPVFRAGRDPLMNGPAIVKPGGLCIKYPGLAKDADGWTYQQGSTISKLFGGKVTENCLSGETEVLTRNGWKRIMDVTPDDLLWDGEAWVPHAGVVCQGEQATIDFGGVQMTPDHEVYINGKWQSADSSCPEEAKSTYARLNRQTS